MLYPEKTPSFQNIFDTYCDINEIYLPKGSEEIVNSIIEKKYSKIITFDKLGFLRYYFDQLVRGEISFEQFMTMGDIEGQIEDQINPHVYREEHPTHLQALTPEIVQSRDKDTLVIIDRLLVAYYNHHHTQFISDANIIIL